MKWWMSFCDPDKPEGEQFLGVAIVEAETAEEMMTRSHLLGLNPGGEVAFVPIPEEGAPSGFDLTERFMPPDEARLQAAL